MDITTFTVNNTDGTITEWVRIDRGGNNEYTSMPKSVYDSMIAQQTNGEQPTA